MTRAPTPPRHHTRTPAWAVDRLFEKFARPVGRRWLEPCAGEGGIITAVSSAIWRICWTAVETRKDCIAPLAKIVGSVKHAQGRVIHGDFFQYVTSATGIDDRYDVAILHPPMLLADGFLRYCREMAKVTIALLPLDLLASSVRWPWLHDHMPRDVYILPNRVIRPDEERPTEPLAWMIWYPGENKIARTQMLNLTEKPPRKRKNGRITFQRWSP
jgi:hypothetical protein